MRIALWIVGEPAAGKSTLSRSMLGNLSNMLLNKQKWALGRGWMSPGHYEGGNFDGADRVGMSQARAYLDFYLGLSGPVAPSKGILLDGARFSTRPCFEQLRSSHRALVCFVSSPDCEARREARGWAPDRKWLAGAITRAKRFRDFALQQGATEVSYTEACLL